jgi:hypothetical protein
MPSPVARACPSGPDAIPARRGRRSSTTAVLQHHMPNLTPAVYFVMHDVEVRNVSIIIALDDPANRSPRSPLSSIPPAKPDRCRCQSSPPGERSTRTPPESDPSSEWRARIPAPLPVRLASPPIPRAAPNAAPPGFQSQRQVPGWDRSMSPNFGAPAPAASPPSVASVPSPHRSNSGRARTARHARFCEFVRAGGRFPGSRRRGRPFPG